jgi:uncharacterized membrane protein YdjX (TVP38/TMEM64 family)
MSLSSNRSRILLLAAIALLLLGGLAFLRLAGPTMQPEDIRDTIRAVDSATGMPVSPLVLILLLAGILVVPVLPAIIFQVASGLAFGPAWGLLYVLLADVLGAAIGFVLARRWGLPLLRRWLKPEHLASAERLAARLDWKGIILLRLLPGPAYPLVSFAAGLSPLSLRRYVLASFTGVLPSLALLVLAGDIATESPWLGVALVLVLIAGLVLAGRIFKSGQDT